MKKTSLLLMVLQVPLDYLLLLLAAASAYVLRFSDWAVALRPVQFGLSYTDFMQLAFQVGIIWILIFAWNGLYTFDPHKKFSQVVHSLFFATATGLAFVALYVLFTQAAFDSRFLVLMGWVLAFVYVLIGRLIVRGLQGVLYRRGMGLSRVVLIGDAESRLPIVHTLKQRKALGYEVIHVFDHFDNNIAEQIAESKIDDIIVTNPRAQEKDAFLALEWATEHHVGFQYAADVFASFTSNTKIFPLAGIPFFVVQRTKLEGWGKVLKRLFDIIGSIGLILLFSPIMILTAIAIKLDSKGPVLFVYERVGRHGELFTYFKFRSMVQDAHDMRYDDSFRKNVEDTRGWTEDEPIIKYKDDPRITRVGKFIRRWSIDELPEFFLVLFGRMSLVGPRPHEEKEVEKYQRHHKRVLTIKPGITGLSQISGRSDLSFEDEVRLDVFYIEHWNFFLDLIILLKTPFVLIKKRVAL